jgi:hypothetical protein
MCHITHPSHPPDLITWIIFGEQHKTWSSSLWNFLQFPVTSSSVSKYNN